MHTSANLVATGAPAPLPATGAVPWRAAAVIAALFLLAHLPWWPAGADDLDAANFMAGVQQFDPARHQPHPPGYPVYIAMGKVSAALLHVAGVSPAGGRREAWALAVWSMLGGAALVLVLVALFTSLQRLAGRYDPSFSLSAAALTVAAPLTWLGGARPMSDVPGLAIALAAQALAFNACAADPATPRGARLFILSALVAGLAVGVRVQTLLLTGPALALATLLPGRIASGVPRTTATRLALMAFLAGCLSWFVPMVVATGGLDRYAAALGWQAGDDFGTAIILWSRHSVAAVISAVASTFLNPWDRLRLAATVLGLAAVGAVVLVRRAPKLLALLLLAFVPYVAFHLMFQETETTRYALPTMPLVAALACGAFAATRAVLQRAAAAVLIAACLTIDLPLAREYSQSPLPIHGMLRATSEAKDRDRPALAVVHQSIAQTLRPSSELPAWLRAPGYGKEWGELAAYWRTGGVRPVWLLADNQRADLLRLQLPLIDPAAWRRRETYHWPLVAAGPFGGARPADVTWYRIDLPRWWLGGGWTLTPELGGEARSAGQGPAAGGGISGSVRREPTPVAVMIGGRHLGAASDPAVRFEFALDGVVVERWQVTSAQRAFLRTFSLPRIPDGAGKYATMTVVAHAADASERAIPAAIEQFDLQPEGVLMTGFGRGWHEPEVQLVGARHRGFRWTSESADLVVHGTGSDLVLRLEGEAPRRRSEPAPEVVVRAGDRVFGRAALTPEFTWQVAIDGAAVVHAGGVITITTSRTFSPADAGGSGDVRRLGLRIYECDVLAR